MSKNFGNYKGLVDRAVTPATKRALKTPVVKHVDLFGGLINREGNIHSMVEQTTGGITIGGEVNLSSLQRNTDIPTIAVNDNTGVTTNDVASNISKMQCSTIDMTNPKKDIKSIIEKNVEANITRHLMKIDDILIQGDEALELQNVYGVGSHPKVPRMFNEGGKQVKEMDPKELLNFFMEVIQKFSQANLTIDFMETLTFVVPPSILNKISNSSLNIGGNITSVRKVIEDQAGIFSKVVFKQSTAVNKIRPHLPKNEGKEFFALGFFDRFFAEANIPVAPTLFGAIGLNSHQENATFMESYFVSKCLGINIKNIGDDMSPIAVIEGA